MTLAGESAGGPGGLGTLGKGAKDKSGASRGGDDPGGKDVGGVQAKKQFMKHLEEMKDKEAEVKELKVRRGRAGPPPLRSSLRGPAVPGRRRPDRFTAPPSRGTRGCQLTPRVAGAAEGGP